MTLQAPLKDTQLVPQILEQLEIIHASLGSLGTKKNSAEIEEKITVLENLKSQLYAALSNLDYAYHQGQLPYDEYRNQMATLLFNKPIDYYVDKIDHLIQSCRDRL